MEKYINGDIGVLFWNYGQVDVCDMVGRSIVHMHKEEAINVARAILRHFEEEEKCAH